MKLKFDATLGYQQDAVGAVVKAFDGQPMALDAAMSMQSIHIGGLFQTELGLANRLQLEDDQLLRNVQAVQEANGIEKISALQGRHFSIEMETGTGKTYVYLRTIFELNKAYGFRKFIIVVPSVPIREGVLKSIEITRAHFEALYNNVRFDHFVYDSKRLNKVRQFSSSNQIQIMIINIQSFQKDVADKDIAQMSEEEKKKLNVINRDLDRMQGRRPIDFIQAACPVVIIDEPQSVDTTDKSRKAIANLNPMATLRYSATHHTPYNLLYKLDPVRAYDLRLVKRIEVASVREEESFNDAYVKLLATDNKKGIKAQIEIHEKTSDGPRPKKLWVKKGDDLFQKSKERDVYKSGYIVQTIDCTPGFEHIEFNQGRRLEPGQAVGGLTDEVMREQVRETVEQHLKKERLLKGRGIKVLSLFFIDRVANYRVYNDDGSTSLGKIGLWFEEAYRTLTAKEMYRDVIPFDVSRLHNGYFSKDKQGKAKDTNGSTGDDSDTYSLIMREKERLLDPQEPLRFIFSHSALREGWDNPNVFQICTLNETQSTDKKRQEIGRGLRLPVNADGERVHDDAINRLTVIANESYKDFADKLQKEFQEDFGIEFGKVTKISFAKLPRTGVDGAEVELGQDQSRVLWQALADAGYLDTEGKILSFFDPRTPHFDLKVPDDFVNLKPMIIDVIKGKIFSNRLRNARDTHSLKFRKEVQLSPEFIALWDRIKHRTRYRVSFDTTELVRRAIVRIKQNIPTITPPRISMTLVAVDISDAGVTADRELSTRMRDVNGAQVLPDLLAFLQKETELTRHTLVEILKSSGRLGDYKVNPQAFMAAVAREISRALHDLMLEGIKYEAVKDHFWEMSRLERDVESDLVRYLSNLYMVQNGNKAIYDAIEVDSEVERQFARDLDNNDDVRLFVKLPWWFKIDTPIGTYNPDWAFVTQREEKLYFVRETKSTTDSDELRSKEKQKIACGREHFKTIGVDFDVVTSLAHVKM